MRCPGGNKTKLIMKTSYLSFPTFPIYVVLFDFEKRFVCLKPLQVAAINILHLNPNPTLYDNFIT